MSACVDVVTPIDFDAPLALPTNTLKITSVPVPRPRLATRTTSVASKSSDTAKAAPRGRGGASSLVDRLPRRGSRKSVFGKSMPPRSLYDDDDDDGESPPLPLPCLNGDEHEPSYLRQFQSSSAAAESTEFVPQAIKREKERPKTLKIIDWKAASRSSSSVSLSVASSSSSSLSSSAFDVGYESDNELAADEMLTFGDIENFGNTTRQPPKIGCVSLPGAPIKRRRVVKFSTHDDDDDDGDDHVVHDDPPSNNDDGGDDEDDAPRTSRANRNTLTESHSTADADPLAGYLNPARGTEPSEVDLDLARIIAKMEDF